MPKIHSTTSSSADLPFSNVFNTRCDICSHPIAHSDINILQPCCCGPFHNYCITNLELQARDANPNNLAPLLQCPHCRHSVTAIAFDFVNHIPRSTRPPFTNSCNLLPRPAPASSPIPCPQRLQPPPQHFLPMAIHDIRPISPSHQPENPPWSPYPKPTTPPLPRYYSATHHPLQTSYNNVQESASFPPYRPLSSHIPPPPHPPPPPPPPPMVPDSSPYHSSHRRQTIPTAPPVSQDEHGLPHDISDCFPPPSQDFRPHSSRKAHQSEAHAKPGRRHASNFAAESRTKGSGDRIELPSPHNAIPPSPMPHRSRRRHHSHLADKTKNTNANSPNTIVIRRHVSEEDVRKGLYGDDVYKAYVQGTAKLLRENPSDGKRQARNKNMKVKVDMDVHLFHHYKPYPSLQAGMDDRNGRDRDRRKDKATEKSWWKSPRAVSLLDSRERRYRKNRPSSRGSPS